MSKSPISNKQHPSDSHYASPTIRGNNISGILQIISSTSDKIKYAIHPRIDIIKQIEQKIKDGNPLNSTEKLQYEHYKSRQEEEIKTDLLYISNENYKLQTPEGFSVRIINMINEQLQKITQSVHTNKHWENIYILLRKLKVRGNLEYIQSNPEYNNILGCAEKVYTNGILNLLNVQLTVTASMAPPLGILGAFNALDPYQKEFLDNIQCGESVMVSASTGGGKTVLTLFGIHRFIQGPNSFGMFVVPTPILASQALQEQTISSASFLTLDSMYGNNPDDVFAQWEKSRILIVTYEALLRYLLLISEFLNKDKRHIMIAFDEVHCLGASKQYIPVFTTLVGNDNFQCILLSATLGNKDEFLEWLNKQRRKPIIFIENIKRYFNNTIYVPQNQKGVCSLKINNPLAHVTINQIKEGSILSGIFQIVPAHLAQLIEEMNKNNMPVKDMDTIEKDNLQPQTILSLDNIYKMYYDILRWMCGNFTEHSSDIANVLSAFKTTMVDKSSLSDVMSLLRPQKKQIIVFTDTGKSVISEGYKLLEFLEKENEINNPDSVESERAYIREKQEYNDAMDAAKKAGPKQLAKYLQENPLPQPSKMKSKDGSFGPPMQYEIDNLEKELPPCRGEQHKLLRLLCYGIVLYARHDLPERYLDLGMKLAYQGQVRVVIATHDLSLGVNAAFQWCVIMPQNDLTPTKMRQMSGRVGRRGMANEGNVIVMDPTDVEKLNADPSNLSPSPIEPSLNAIAYINSRTEKGLENTIKLPLDTEDLDTNLREMMIHNITGGWNSIVSPYPDLCVALHPMFHQWNFVTICYLLNNINQVFCHKDPIEEQNQIALAGVLLSCTGIYKKSKSPINFNRPSPSDFSQLVEKSRNELDKLKLLPILQPDEIDWTLYNVILANKLSIVPADNRDEIKKRLFEFTSIIQIIQHHFTDEKNKKMSTLFSKLYTRLLWIDKMSSPIYVNDS